LSFTADGSFAMACGELETVSRFQLPIIYVQLTNYSMGWIKMLQHLYFDDHYFGVDPGPTDAVMVAAASGVKGVRVRSLDEFTAVLRDAVASRKPVYIDVVVPHMIELAPPVAPWQAALAGDSERPVY
jgi:acetolactate synthase-1/2/3 large subunit